MSQSAVWIFFAGLLVFGWGRTLAFLRYFQQEEYNRQRFGAWLAEKRAFDTRGTLVCLSVAILALLLKHSAVAIALAVVAATALSLIVRTLEEDPRRSGKIKLVMTERATKIAWLAFALFALVASIPLLWLTCSTCHTCVPALTKTALYGVVLVQLPALCVVIANGLLWPAEKARQDAFISEAKAILKEVNPFVIGITGSYGKTGAKAALGELLSQSLAPTFWPKKSINTVLGITRAIRETMKPFHKYAVIEMGAYKIGSIKRLCEFTPPKAALVTSVGIMHLERFGSPENVYLAKSEIAQALPSDGLLVCNGDSPNAKRMAKEHPAQTTLLYGLDQTAGDLDCYASDISFNATGTRFTLHWRGKSYQAVTPLLGRPALSNCIGAFTMACALGADPTYVIACMANLEPVDNRLVLDTKSPVAYLRDAYNSNPTGFVAALEVLQALPATRRVLMTPGMIELGDQQFDHNKAAAKMAAGICDLVIIVGVINREALLAGLREANYPEEKTLVVDNRDQAFSAVSSRCSKGDLVLIENDLGDLHEGKVRF